MDLVGSNVNLSSQQYQTADAKKKDSSGAGSLFTNELRPYAKWAAISTIAAVGIASVAFILYQYAHSDANLDDHSVGVGGSSNGSDEAASTLGKSNLNPYDKPRKEPVDCILNLLDRKYEGKCLNGKANGQGTEILDDGQTCIGEWENGEFTGQGKCTWPDSTSYEGSWKDGLFHGQGTEILEDGQICTGDWENGEFTGQGKCTWPDSTSYEGSWKDGLRHGQGVTRYLNGAICTGEWQNDILISGKGNCKIEKG